MENVNEYYNYLIEQGIATEAELNLITSINGYNIDTLNDVLYCRTGYRDYEQYTGADVIDDDDDEPDEADELDDNGRDERLDETLAAYNHAGING